jgi:probable HAF family extracellular repeat protein
MSQKLSRPAAAALVAAGLSIAAPAQALQYTLTDLGIAAGFTSSLATSVNDQGQMVGNNNGGSGPAKSFVWTAATGMQLLTPLTPTGVSYAAMINNSGVIAGQTDWTKATLWSSGSSVPTQLPGLASGLDTAASAINNSNVIAGSAKATAGGQNQATLWSPTGNGYTATGLGFVPGRQWGTALDVNSSGQVVGEYVNGSWLNRLAFVWTDAGTGLTVLPFLSGGSENEAYAINDAGMIAGVSGSTNGNRAVAWTKAGGVYTPADLGVLAGDTSSMAVNVNNSGTVVGRSNGTGGYRGFVWTAASGMVDLNSVLTNGTGWTVTYGFDVNNNDWIVGQAVLNGVTHAVLLTPVPAPGGLLLFAAGLLGLGLARRAWG